MDGATDFADAFDAATADPRADNLDRLRDAADRLMRAAGRVIIETQRQRTPRQ